MVEGTKAIVVSERASLAEKLADDVASAIGDIKRVSDYEIAFSRIKENRPDAVFLFLTDDTLRDMQLVRRITRHMPEIKVFIIAEENRPEIILEGLRAKVTDYLIFPSSNGEVLASVRHAMGDIDSRRGEVIAVFSLKGGQGNTSMCINLADHIHKISGEKILLADFNLYRGDMSAGLDITPSYTSFDMIKDIERMDRNLLFSSLQQHSSGIYVLPAPDEISDADQVSPEDTTRILGLIGQYMDYTILDLPHDLSERNLALLDAADRIIVTAQQSLQVIKSVQRTMELFYDLGYGEEKVKIVLNRYHSKGEFNSNDLKGIFKQPVTASIANDYETVMLTLNKGKPLSVVREKSRINSDYANLASAITGIKTDCERAGFFSRLFGA